jgi:hypothetical protein
MKKAVFFIVLSVVVLFFGFLLFGASKNNSSGELVELGSIKPFLDNASQNSSGASGETGELGSLNPISQNQVVDKYSKSKEMHWPNLPLKFQFQNCTDYQTNRLNVAMEYISAKIKAISFQSSNDSFDLVFVCSQEQKDRGFVAGEAELNYYVGTSLFAPSKVYIYHAQHCVGRRPTIEIHELMHVFGVNHSSLSDWNDLMNPYTTRCEADISLDTVDYLDSVYSSENLQETIAGFSIINRFDFLW